MRFLIIFLAVIFLLAPSCQEKQAVTPEEVMAIHDAVMPRMADMQRYRRDLLRQADGLDSLQAIPLQEAARKLLVGEEMMWTWMNAYKPPQKGTPNYQSYLLEQRTLIQAVRDSMELAISEAERILTK